MTNSTQNTTLGSKAKLLPTLTAALLALTLTNQVAQAQEAIGVPFTGKNHLSFYLTELSRDGIGTERAALFGGMYGRRFSGDAPLQISMIVRAAARALNGTEDGIVDSGLTLAATHHVAALSGLSITGAAGVNVMAWGREAQAGELDSGRAIFRAPLNAGMAYDIRVGGATIAPFVSVTGAYSNERDYVGGDRIATDSGWRVGQSAGMSVRFREAVLSVSGVNRERGLPNNNRVAFSAGISW